MKLQIRVTGIRSERGKIFIALFERGKGFPDDHEQAVSWALLDPALPETEWEVDVNPNTDYAVTVFHDLNGNQQLDKNLLGIPKEPIGFSNDARPVMGPPSYLNARFIPAEHPEGIRIRLFSF
jgi:uncharacterized protein (DUF2141 family)